MTKYYPMLQKYLIADLPMADELLPHLRRLDASRRYANFGVLSQEFEQRLQKMLSAVDPCPGHGTIHVTTMSTGYHALEVALRILKIRKGGKVLVPAVTFPACPLAAHFANLEAVLADVDDNTWMLTPDIARRVAASTPIDAVMPVALYGVPVPVEGWDRFTEETGIPVLIDAAAAIETQAIPRQGLVAHSLHATKPFGVGEGGLLVGRNPQHITSARVYSNFGTYDRIATVEGSNTKMSEYHAAVGIQQTIRWPYIRKKRTSIFELYLKHLEPLMGELSLQPGIGNAVVSTLMLRFEQPVAAGIIACGKENDIAFHAMYLPPLYHHPHLSNLAVASGDGIIQAGSASLQQKAATAVNSEELLHHCVGVPFHPFLSESDIAHVADALDQLLSGISHQPMKVIGNI